MKVPTQHTGDAASGSSNRKLKPPPAHLPELGADLVAALASLDVNDFAHGGLPMSVAKG